MITSAVISSFFDYMNSGPLNITYIQQCLVAGVHYKPGLAFDSKIREKVVREDATKDFWVYTLFERSLLTPSGNQPRKLAIAMNKTTIDDKPYADLAIARGGQMTVTFKYVANSISVIEEIEEALICWDPREVFECDLAALGSGFPVLRVGIKEFELDSLEREDGDQYGSVTGLTGHAILEYAVFRVRGTYPTIANVVSSVLYQNH